MSGEVCAAREREVPHGTLIKMYDYKAPRSNVCGELFRKLEEYLLRPMLPLRIVECRPEYKANVMGVTVWDASPRGRAEESLRKDLKTAQASRLNFPAERPYLPRCASLRQAPTPYRTPIIRRLGCGPSSTASRTLAAILNSLRARLLIKEHIGGSMLVTLDCSDLGQTSRNALFMSNRETFREDPLLTELFKKLQNELRHP